MDKKTIDTYNERALEYDAETADFWEQFPKTFLDQFAAASGKKVLNIGSGPGRDGLLLKGLGKEVLCLDASEEMVKMSRERGLESIVGDFTLLPFEDCSFDAVWSYTALLHVPKKDVGKALDEINRVLISKGVFGLGLVEGYTEEYRESSGVNMPRWFAFYTKEEIQSLVQEYGFELVHFESFKPRSKNYLNFIFRKTG